MFDGFLKSKFYSKCKSNIKLINTRLEGIKKKRKAVQKYLKNDIADLLRNGLDINAYGRAEGLLVEQNMSTCYEFIEKFCGCISNHLSVMHKQRDCPEECKEAVASLIFAAARFADLPELRDLRATFTEKYGNSVDSFTNKEFVERLRSNPPTKEMKLQLLQDTAQESNKEWVSKGLEQRLYTPLPKQERPKCAFLSDDDDRCQKNKDDAVQERDNQNAGNILSNGKGFITNRNDRDLTFHGRKDVTNDRYRMPSSSEDETTTDLSQDGLKNSSSSVGSVSEDDVEIKRPLVSRFTPPPYHKKKADKNESSSEEPTKLKGHVDKEEAQHINDPAVEDKPKPRSVRRRNLKPPPGYGVTKIDSTGTKPDTRQGLRSIFSVDSDPKDEERKLDGLLMQFSKDDEDRKLDGLLMQYSTKQSQQRDRVYGEYRRNRTKSDLDAPSERTASTPAEPTSTEGTKRHVRATSLQPEMLSMAGHVHPKLPEYDELAARVASLRGR